MQRYQYYAFLSYSREDEAWAKWLHKKLENYQLPSTLFKKYEGQLPKRIRPVFLDKTDIGLGEIEQSITKELEDSRFLIVICSPNAVNSKWVNDEIEFFKKLGRGDRIIPFIVEGTPNPKFEGEKQCYPDGLDKNLLGASLEDISKEQAFIKIVASILGLKFDELWQRHRRKEKRKKGTTYGAILTVTLLLVICSWVIWDQYYRVTIKFYSDYVDRWGIPNGINELSSSQVAKRNRSFEFRYQGGKLRSVSHINSRGHLINTPPESQIDMPTKQVISYSNSGKLLQIDIEDGCGRLLMSSKYSGDNFDEIDFKDMKGKDIALFNSTTPMFLGELNEMPKTNINHYTLQRNGSGEIEKVYFKSSGFATTSNMSGTFGYQYILDSLGRERERLYLGKAGTPEPNSFGIISEKTEYDQYGNYISFSYYDSNGRLVLNTDEGFARAIREYDINGNAIRVAQYGMDGKPILGKSGVFAYIVKYNDFGDLIEKTCLNENSDPCFNKDGVAKIKSKFNQEGLVIEEAYFNLENQPTYDNHGVSIFKLVYNNKSICIEEKYYDTQGNPTFSNEKLSACTKYKFNENDYLIEVAYFGTDNLPCFNNEGVSIYRYVYDDRGFQIEQTSFDVYNKPCYCRRNYFKRKTLWDARGNPIQLEYFGLDSMPCIVDDGYAMVKLKLNDVGLCTELSYFDTDSLPCFILDGYSIDKREYDLENNKMITSYSGIDGLPCLTNNWYSKVTGYFNSYGKLTDYNYYDEHDNLIFAKDKFAIRKQQYDQNGNLSAEHYFGPDSKPCLVNDYAFLRTEHDGKGNIMEVRSYDTRGELINSKKRAAIKRWAYDSKGNQIEESYFDRNNSPCTDNNLFTKVKMKYDEFNRLVEEQYMNSENQLQDNSDGYAIERKGYDSRGNEVQTMYFNKDNKPCLYKKQYSIVKREFNKKDERITIFYYDAHGNPCLNEDKVAGAKFEYNNNWVLIERENYGIDGKPCLDIDGIAKFSNTVDKRRNRIEQHYYVLNGNTQKIPDQPASLRFKYDNKNRRTEILCLNADNTLCLSCNNYCPIVTISYNKKGQVDEKKYFNNTDRPAQRQGQFFRIKFEYNNRGEMIKEMHYDANGNRVYKM